jgi:hypothetical protein
MLTTLLVIIACIVAGTIVNHFHPGYRKWRSSGFNFPRTSR